jgi:hypothetical protein
MSYTHNPDIFLTFRIESCSPEPRTFVAKSNCRSSRLPWYSHVLGPGMELGQLSSMVGNLFVSTGIGTSSLPVRFGVP